MYKILKEHSWFIIIFLSVAILRLLPLFNYQLTLDELSGLARTRFDTFGDLIELGVKTTDTHPALVQLIIFATVKLFGYHTWIVKLPFILFSLFGLLYFYKFGCKFFNKQTGIVAAIIAGFSLLFVFYAPIARMYSSGVFFSIALLYYFTSIFFKYENSIKNYFLFGLFCLLCALNQHLNMLFAFTVAFFGLFHLNKTNAKNYLITCGIIVLAYLPHLPVTLAQFKVGGIGLNTDGWVEKPEWYQVFIFIKILLGTGKSYFVVLALIAVCCFLNKKIKPSGLQIFLLVLFVFNYLIIFSYSNLRSSVYQFYVMQFSGVAFVIVISSYLNTKNNYLFGAITVLLASTLIFKTYLKKNYYQQCVKTVFENQFEVFAKYQNLKGKENISSVFFDCDDFMKTWFSQKYNCSKPPVISGDSSISSTKAFANYLANNKTNYIVVASSFPLNQALVKEYYPYLIESYQTQAINIKVYSKLKSDSVSVNDDQILYYSNFYNKQQFNYPSNASLPIPLDSLNEFPFGIHSNLNACTSKEGQYVLLKSKLKLSKPQTFNLAACLMNKSIDDKESYAYTDENMNSFVVNKDSTVTLYAGAYCGTKYKNYKDKAKFSAYLWNRDKKPATLLNFEIKTLDFWTKKWNYWE